MLYNLLKKFRHVIIEFRVRKFRRLKNGHEFITELVLKDDSSLVIKDYLFLDGSRKYAYHWQDKKGKLIVRWDNAPHWKNISTYPHHKHIRRAECVEDSDIRNIDQALKFISNTLGNEGKKAVKS